MKFRSDSPPGEQSGQAPPGVFPFSLRITLEGAAYISLAFLLSLAAVNTGNNLLYVIVASMLSAIAVSGIVSRSTLKRISLSLQLPENVFAGDRVSIKVSMKNMKRFFPSFSISVEDPGRIRGIAWAHLLSRLHILRRTVGSGDEEENRSLLRQSAYFPVLCAGETRSEHSVQTFPRRGLYHLEGFWISTRFPFGLFRRGELISAKGEVLVYPRVREISSFFHLLPFLSGRLESPRAGPGENLFSIRKYQDGESARIIDWKATAKTGELMAKEYAREEEGKFCLVLDTRLYAPGNGRSESDFEKAVSLAASLAAHFLEEGAVLAFLAPHEWVPPGSGPDHRNRILRRLAVIERERSLSGADAGLWDAESPAADGSDPQLQEILSDKVFKIILTSRPKGRLPSSIWRSSHVIYFDEL